MTIVPTGIGLAALMLRVESGGLGAVCERGRREFAGASAADLASLRMALEPVYDMLERDPRTRELIAAIPHPPL